MPVSFNWTPADILHVQYFGIIDGDDAVDASLRMSADPRFDYLKGIIIDTLNIDENIATEEHVEQLVSISHIMSRSNPRIRNAIVLCEDEKTTTLAALYTYLATTLVWEVQMLQTMDEAVNWVLQAYKQADSLPKSQSCP